MASNLKTLDVEILKITKSGEGSYKIKVRYKKANQLDLSALGDSEITDPVNIDLPGGDFTTTEWTIKSPSQTGVNLDEAIKLLNIDQNGTWPANLSSISGTVTVSTTGMFVVPVRMEIDTTSLKMIRSYDSALNNSIGKIAPDSKYVYTYDFMPQFSGSDPYVKGRCDAAIDGDTLRITISEVNGLQSLQVGKPLTIRLIGVNCPETQKTEGDWYSRNEKWASDHGLEVPTEENKIMTKITSIAAEGKKFMQQFEGMTVVVDPEQGSSTFDTYGRLLGVVYINANPAITGRSETAICLNTSIIANSSVADPDFALAEPVISYSIGTNGVMTSKFPIQTWWKYAPNYEEKKAELEEKEQQKQNTNGKAAFLKKYGLEEVGETTVDNKTEIRYNSREGLYEKDKLNNYNDVPADSKDENYENMVVDDRNALDKQMGFDPYDQFHLRIGDSTFLVPPLSIKMDTVASNRRVQALRSKSSIQTQSGHSETVITVDLYFPNNESVNGYACKNPAGGESYYRNGLRPLIAQFKKAPFLPIENELINERFKVYAVVLKDLEVSTVPGFPECLTARLTLSEFDHTIYMPSEEDFASTFCWPLYRWFYQRSMRKNNDPARTYLAPIARVDNSISFKIPDEAILVSRRSAINELLYKIDPQVYKSSNSATGTTMGEMIREADEVKMAKEQYSGFRDALSKCPPEKYPEMYNSKGQFDLTDFDIGRLSGDANKKKRLSYLNAFYEIISWTYFGGTDPDGLISMYFVINTIDKLFEALSTLAKEFWSKQLDGNSSAFDFVASTYPVIRCQEEEGRGLRVYNREKLGWDYVKDLAFKDGWRNDLSLPSILKKYVNPSMVFPGGGVFIIEMKSSNAKKAPGRIIANAQTNVPDYHHGDVRTDLESQVPPYYAINPGDAAILNLISDTGEATELSFVDYTSQFEKINMLAHMSEADIPEVDFPISNIYVQSITSRLHNNFAPLQLLSQESPTFQHMGSSDIEMEIVIRTKNREAVDKFRQLMSTAQRLAREYKIALTSGVVSIDTPLMAIFGVRSILIERLSVETSKEDRESFNIVISMVAFDKTQRMAEDLNMVKAMGGTQEEIENAFYAYTERRRNESGFEYAIVDFTLRDLELYPDLELPTFEELNKDLPKLGIKYPDGTPFKKYPNPDAAKFVDPDFYIRCEHTFRDYILATLEDGEVPMYLQDRLGFEGFDVGPNADQQTNGGMTSPNLQFSDETLKWVVENLSNVYTGPNEEQKNEAGGWAGTTDMSGIETNVYDKNTMDIYEATGVVKATVGGMAPDVPKETQNKITQESVSKKPTTSEVISWGEAGSAGGSGSFTLYTTAQGVIDSLREPTDQEFIDHLNYLVCNKYFKNLPSDAEALRAGSTDVDTYRYGKTRVSAPKITKEKVVNVLKALYDLEHSWRQFNSDGTVCWSKTNDIGIGQLNAYSSGILQNLDMARHAAWFWRYNLELGVEFFAQQYNFCVSNGRYNGDAPVNPLDWAIVCYNRGPVSGLKNYSQPQEVDYYNAVMTRFKNKYGASALYMSASPRSLYNAQMANTQVDPQARLAEVKKKVGLSQQDLTKDKALQTYIDTERTLTNAWKSVGKFVDGIDGKVDNDWTPTKDTRTEMEKQLDDYKEYSQYYAVVDNTLIIDIYGEFTKWDKSDMGKIGGAHSAIASLKESVSTYIAGMIKSGKVNSTTQYIRIKQGASDAYTKQVSDISKLFSPDYSNILEVRNVEENAATDLSSIEIQQAIKPVLVSPDDIAVLYRSSFKDIMEYDHHGRMLRAFPTFQMFLIDEGRWMAWHKLWDNFYGYNSIMSIDLIRDRKIAADTAVISMTNIYNNLSAYDNETSYGEWDYTLGDLIWGTGSLLGDGTRGKVWKTIWDLPDKEILAARRDELNSMMLKPGARIHLRMGYGSNAYRLPVVFNGTVSEMDTGELITIVAQGDGVELTNKLRVSPGDTNVDGLGILSGTMEPRECMCKMLTCKADGSNAWLKNLVNAASGGVFFNENPLGIVHFGVSEVPMGTLLNGLDIFNHFENYGECGQNIYCSAGINTMSQWIYTEGSKKGQEFGYKWNWTDFSGITEGDEPNIKIDLFDRTPWSVFQLYAHACPDYIATVLPFEFRSTVFYGKPWWGVIDKYDYKYYYDNQHDMFVREPYNVSRKALSQVRVYSCYFDIINNGIKATEELMYTNVIGMYDSEKKKTRVIQADSDIYTDKQTTAIIHIPIKSDMWWQGNKWTQERYAECVATSALRDYMKDMYQGELVVLGDPTAKPYDKMYLQDNLNDMSGMSEIQRVIHHFSAETGFITCITPDCISVIDDARGISINTWIAGTAAGALTFVIGLATKNLMWKKMWNSPVAAFFRKWGSKATNKLFTQVVANMADAGPEDRKTLEAISDSLVDYFRGKLKPGATATSLNADLMKKELNTILRKNGTYKAVDDKVLQKASTILQKTGEAIKTKGGVGSYVDKLWDSSEILKEGKLFTKGTKPGLVAKVGDGIISKVSKIAKFGLKNGGNATASVIRGTSAVVSEVARSAALRTTLIGLAVDVGITILTASVVEEYGRWLKSRQALTIVPMKYRGKPLVAGINGHKGLVAGENVSGWDKFLSGTGFGGGIVSGIYGFFGVDTPNYSKSEEDATSDYMGN